MANYSTKSQFGVKKTYITKKNALSAGEGALLRLRIYDKIFLLIYIGRNE